MAAVIEFQGFYGNDDKFIIKELAIVSDSFQTQILFKSPYCRSTLDNKQQRTARWLIRHLHGIKWSVGSVEYNESLIRLLCSNFNTIYTKGYDKVRFFKQFHPNVYELPSTKSHSPTNDDDVITCLLPQHNNNNRFKCALKNAHFEYKILHRH